MEGIVDVYEQHFTFATMKTDYSNINRHSCLICRTKSTEKVFSYGRFDRETSEKNIIEYLQHLKIFGFSKKLTLIFTNSIRESGILCKKVHGWWEFKEDQKYSVFIIEHCLKPELEEKIEIPKILSPSPTFLQEEEYPKEKVKYNESEL